MSFLRLCILVFSVAFATISSAQETPVITPAHRAAVARFLKAMHADELAMQGIKIAAKKFQTEDPKYGPFLAEFVDEMRPAQIMEKMVPVYAKYYSTENAEAVASFFESPVGRKSIEIMMGELKTGAKTSLDMAQFTPAEKQTIARFEQSPAGRLMGQAQGKINAEGARVFEDWSREILRKKYAQAFAPIVKEIDGSGSGTAVAAASSGTMDAKGSGFFSQFGALVAETARRTRESRDRFQNSLRTLDVGTILAPQNLVTAGGIAQGKEKVKRFHELLDALLTSSDAILQDTRRQAEALEMPAKIRVEFVRGLEKGMASALDETIRFGEIERNVAELFERTLEFSESRLGKTTYNGSQLLFADQADLDTYRSLMAQIKVEGAKESDLEKESAERQKKALTQFSTQ